MSTVVGDSVVSQVDEREEDVAVAAGVKENVAVAAGGSHRPKQNMHTRIQRPTAPVFDSCLREERRKLWEAGNTSETVGNIGWLFGNWGKLPRDSKKRTGSRECVEKKSRHGHWSGRVLAKG